MGNCIQTPSYHHHLERVLASSNQQQQHHQRRETAGQVKASAVDENGGGGTRVKILLTKAELQQFMFQLQMQKSKGERRLEEILEEIQRGRSRIAAAAKFDIEAGLKWKPCLERINEDPAAVE